MSLPPPLDRILRHLHQAWARRAIHLKALSVALVCVVNFAVDFSVFAFAYYGLGLSIIAANVCAWAVAVTGSYVLNSLTTFAAESGRQLRMNDYATFVVSQMGALVANTATVFVLSYALPVLVAKLLAIGASFLVNFSLS